MPESNDSVNSNVLKPMPTTDLVLEMREIGGAAVETIDGRRLHRFLEVGKDFSTWVRDRIVKYDFIEGIDFVFLPNSGEKSGRGQPAKEYAFTIDMAKELSMVERNAKGKQARLYFIECEKRLKAATCVPPAASAQADVSREYRLTMQQNVRWAKMAGLDGNQALLAANRATTALTGIDTLGLLGLSHMTAPQNAPLLTPTEIGRRMDGLSAQSVNRMLCQRGLQVSFRDAKRHTYYEPTQSGIAAGGVMQDTGKRHDSGTPVRQLRWASSVIEQLTAEPALF